MDALSYLLGKKAGGGGGGTSNYNELSNKPQINSVELSGNKALADLGIQGEITSTNKLDASLVDDSLSTNKFVTSAEKTIWNGKQDLLTAGDNITINNGVISASKDIYIIDTDIYTSSNPFIFEEHPLGRYYLKISNTNFGTLYCKGKSSETSISSLDIGPLSYIDYNIDITNVSSFSRIGNIYLAFNEQNSQFFTQIAGLRYNPNASSTLDVHSTYAKIFYMTTSSIDTITGKKTFSTLPESSVVPTTNNQLVNKKYVDDNIPSQIQYSTMPTATSETVGKIVQYIGTTTNNYTNGYFYIGTSDGQDPATYSWENLNVQDGGGENYIEVFTIDTGAFSFVQTYSPNTVTITSSSTSIAPQFQEFINIILERKNAGKSYPILVVKNSISGDAELTSGTKVYYAVTGASSSGIRLKCMNVTTTGGSSLDWYVECSINFDYNTHSFSSATFQSLILIDNTKQQWINGKKTFSVLPESSVTPTTNDQLTNKSYVDNAISTAVGNINTVLASLTTPSGNGGN